MMHQITLNKRILSAENGLLLGNGDLSVSVYQTDTTIVWRFGKGNVWDRRLDLRDDPEPAHIDEVARGLLEEGWQVGPYGGPATALRGSKDEKRMQELCQGSPKSYEERPYPCPKPVGELALHLPPDLTELELSQTLSIEEGVITIICRQEPVFDLTLRCWVDSAENILLVDWKLAASPEAEYSTKQLLWFSLYRWADPRVEVFAANQFADWRTGLCCGTNAPEKAVPLPPPMAEESDGLWRIRQDFYPEKTFPGGSCCLMAALSGGRVELPRWKQPDTAAIHILPEGSSGCLTVGVTATGDPHGDEEGLARLRALANEPDFPERSLATLKASMDAFWSRSSFRCGEPLLEHLWYETLYAFRCICRGGTVPPGLFFPSTVKDYGHWHGDYHSNYNFQQPFWGICAVNHPEGLDSYFDGMEYFLKTGRRIARDYYGARGAFIQLSAFPIDDDSDPIGVVPMGRMAYMTGWAPSLYWERYLCTGDKDWLRDVGYPVIRDCALFFLDFLKKGPDGKYHAFPSNQGEDGFTGNPADFCDCEEVADHLCRCLRTAIEAAAVLGTDRELSAQWQERLQEYAADKAASLPEGSPERWRQAENPAEFGLNYLNRVHGESKNGWPSDGDMIHQWYLGHYPLVQLKRMHTGVYRTETDYPRFLREIRRWRHPNGLCWAMAASRYGRIGAWTETLGMLGPLTESLLQSWDGCLRFFPGLPPEVDASFRQMRARGAFLVSAGQKDGAVGEIEILSEKGGICTFQSPWERAAVEDRDGNPVSLQQNRWGQLCFETKAGETYRLKKA